MLKTMSGRASRRCLREVGVRFEADDVAESGERVGDGVDRVSAVPLGELVVGGLGAVGVSGESGGGEVSPDGDRVRALGRRRCSGVPGRDGVPATTGRLFVAAWRLVVGTSDRGRLRLLIVGESDSRHPNSGGRHRDAGVARRATFARVALVARRQDAMAQDDARDDGE